MALLLLATPTLQGCGPQRASEGNGRPVVLVVVDTLRADRLGLHGHPRPTSPALDARADSAAIFERAFATAPWTLPSFASILTGSLPSRHAAGARPGPAPSSGEGGQQAVNLRIHGREESFSALDPGAPTLPERLRAAGYATAAVVNNPFLHPLFGLSRGFDHYDYEPGGDRDSRRASEMVDRGLAWIEARGNGSFFLMLHLFDPHMDYDAPAPVRGRFTGALASAGSLPVTDTPALRERAARLSAEQRRFVAAAYDEEVAFVDAELGRFLDRLDALGLLSRALVVITADHGEELFDHESFGHGHTLFDEQLHVPLLVLGADVRARRIAAPVSIADIGPTVLEAVGLQPFENAGSGAPEVATGGTGRSLWPVIARGAPAPARPVFAEAAGTGPEQWAIIHWPHKLVRKAGGEAQLYDLEQDPEERLDLAGVDAVRAGALLQIIAQEEARTGRGAPLEPVQLDDETREMLRALGYLE